MKGGCKDAERCLRCGEEGRHRECTKPHRCINCGLPHSTVDLHSCQNEAVKKHVEKCEMWKKKVVYYARSWKRNPPSVPENCEQPTCPKKRKRGTGRTKKTDTASAVTDKPSHPATAATESTTISTATVISNTMAIASAVAPAIVSVAATGAATATEANATEIICNRMPTTAATETQIQVAAAPAQESDTEDFDPVTILDNMPRNEIRRIERMARALTSTSAQAEDSSAFQRQAGDVNVDTSQLPSTVSSISELDSTAQPRLYPLNELPSDQRPGILPRISGPNKQPGTNLLGKPSRYPPSNASASKSGGFELTNVYDLMYRASRENAQANTSSSASKRQAESQWTTTTRSKVKTRANPQIEVQMEVLEDSETGPLEGSEREQQAEQPGGSQITGPARPTSEQKKAEPLANPPAEPQVAKPRTGSRKNVRATSRRKRAKLVEAQTEQKAEPPEELTDSIPVELPMESVMASQGTRLTRKTRAQKQTEPPIDLPTDPPAESQAEISAMSQKMTRAKFRSEAQAQPLAGLSEEVRVKLAEGSWAASKT